MRSHAAVVAALSAVALAIGAGAWLVFSGWRAPANREYQVHGQVLGVDPARGEILVDHEDIPGFMPAMVMPYKVNDAALLDGKTPGDLITATLVVEEVNAYLSAITKTGHGPIKNAGGGPAITDSDILGPGDTVPGTPLVDEAGRPRPLTSWHGHRVALTFMYTRCPLPEFCPLMDRHFRTLQDEIRKSDDLADVRLVSITLDPEFDTPQVLRQHAKSAGSDPAIWTLLTGNTEDVLAVARRFGILTEPGETEGIVVHNLRTAVIDSEGRVVTIHSGNMWTPAELVGELKKTPASTH
jgi:protein SCO1/2